MSQQQLTTASGVDPREQRGIVLAATKHIRQVDGKWRVPSSDSEWHYFVNLAGQTCTCPDHEIRGVKCKHIWAVEYTAKREEQADGSVVQTETLHVAQQRVTYPQDWTAYNSAQTEEKSRFIALLADLCKNIPQPPQTTGRPRLPMSDMAFACAYKVYSGFSSRRFTSDMREANVDGLMASTPHFNRVSSYLSDSALTPIFKSLVIASSLPLKSVETDFAIDSSGFSTSRFVRWYNKKYGRELDNREWVKVHLTCGIQTHIVTAVEVTGWSAADSPYFKPLVDKTAVNFQIRELSADKAYSSHKNMELVHSLGATPFIPFRSNAVQPTSNDIWARMYHWFMLNREGFLEHYHKRSNVESVFSMVKAKFGDSVKSKSDVGQMNEVLAKILCHNICVVNQAMHELGVEPSFGAQMPVARKVAANGAL